MTYKILKIPGCECAIGQTKSYNLNQFHCVGHIFFMDKKEQTIGSCIATAVTRMHVLTSTACLKDNNEQNNEKKFTFKKPDVSITCFNHSI